MDVVNKISYPIWLPWAATIWFFVVIDSFIVWNPLAPIIHLFPSCIVVWASIRISNSLCFSKKRRAICALVFIFMIWIIFTLCVDLMEVIKRMTDYVPLLFVVFWPKNLLNKTYHCIRKIIIFFCVGSSIITILALLNLVHFVPHFTLPARESLHVRLGLVYNVYILFVTIFNPSSGVLTARACGMMQEPGHFAIILGFIYLIDRMRQFSINKWIVICGILTFSSAFFLIVFFTEFYKIFSKHYFKKLIYFLLSLSLLIYFGYRFLPRDIQEQIEFLAYGRNLERVVEAFNTSSSLTGALDERASSIMIRNYEKMGISEFLFGGGHVEEGYSLSDYRGMIINIGLIGMVLSVFLFVVIIMNVPFRYKISLCLSYLLIIIHRSWMLFEPYIYVLSIFAIMLLYRNNTKFKEISAK